MQHSPTADALLNPAQTLAVTSPPSPLLVLAGAGSGKTRVITYRIAYLVGELQVAPYHILAVTFTNKAAREMRERLNHLLGPYLAADLWVGTFHAICARLLRSCHDAVGLTKNFLIYDDADQRSLVNRIAKDLDLDDRAYPPKTLLSSIHQLKQLGLLPSEAPTRYPNETVLAKVYTEYQNRLLTANAVDFDDLINFVTRIGEDPHSSHGEQQRQRFQHVLVDEFQDVNPMQYRLIRTFSKYHESVCVVGDDDQSIYSWRGADVRIIRGFRRDYPNTQTIKLEHNYRSTATIVRAALAVISQAEDREPKELFTDNPMGPPIRVTAYSDEHDEAAGAVSRIRELRAEGIDLSSIAIFYRIHAQSRVLEQALRAQNIPYQIIGGTRYFDRLEIKDVLAYLRTIENPASDVDLLRIINTPARGIGASTLDKLLQFATAHHLSLYTTITESLDQVGLAAAATKKLTAFRKLITTLIDMSRALSLRELTEHVINDTGYLEFWKAQDTVESDARVENIMEFLSSIEEYEEDSDNANDTPTLAGFLERVSLVNDVEQNPDQTRVSLMTVHAAKGLEFDSVVLAGFEEDLFPYRSAQDGRTSHDLEEERRLAYVAITRARRTLTITHAHSRMIFGTTRPCSQSHFIRDIPMELVDSTRSSHRPRPSMSFDTAPRRPERQPPIEGRYVELDEDQPADCGLRSGDRVAHQRFGEGRVRAIINTTTPPLVLVHFSAWGERKVMANFLRPA